MKIKFFLILYFLTSCAAAKWPTEEVIATKNYTEVNSLAIDNEVTPDKLPMYPNGSQGIMALIVKEFKYPEEAQRKGIEGSVILKYTIEPTGYIGRIEVLEGVDPLFENEALRVIKLMERWVPAYKNEKPIAIKLIQPFNLRIIR